MPEPPPPPFSQLSALRRALIDHSGICNLTASPWVLQDLTVAEEAYKDMCDTVNKAERFFPVPSAAMARVEAEQKVEAGKGMAAA